jgi:hypothetical protein
MYGKIFYSQNGTLTENVLATGGGVAEVEQRGAKSGRLTEGPQRLRYATDYINIVQTAVCICSQKSLP